MIDLHACASTPIADAGQRPADEHVLVNPVSGERVVIRESGAQTGGTLLAFDLYLPPGAHVPARHVHPLQEERFTIIGGQMRFRIGHIWRRPVLALPGETVCVPAGIAHWFGNPGPELSHARVEVRPALRMEELFETTAAMDLASNRRGVRMLRLMDLARIAIEFQREVAVPDVPTFLVKAILTALVWLGQRRARTIATRSGVAG